MKRKPRTSVIKARALTDPRPAFVSIVKGGANQTPFRAVKMDPRLIGADEKDADMTTKKAAAPLVAQGYDISALRFAHQEFPTEAAVQAWLDAGGYEGTTIKAAADGFDVLNTEVEFEEGTLTKIDGPVPGLTVYVGKVKVEETTEKTEEEAVLDASLDNPSAVQPVATKGEEDGGVEEAQVSLAVEDVAVDAAMDTTEAVEEVVVEAAAEEPAAEVAVEEAPAVEAATEEDATKGLYEVNVLAEVLGALRWMAEDAQYTGMAEADVSAIKAAAQTLVGVLASQMDDAKSKFTEAFRAAVEPQLNSTVADAAAVEDAAAPADVADEPTVKTEEKPEWMVAIEALTVTVQALTKSIGEVKAKVDETEATNLAERSEAEAPAPAQTRKGADVSGGVEEAQVDQDEVKRKAAADRAAIRLRRSLGVMS